MNVLRDGDKTQEEMIETFNEIESLSEEEIISYGESDYVSSYYYTYSLGVNAKDLTEATDSLVKETTTTKTTTDTKSFSGGQGGPGVPGSHNFEGGSQTTRKTTTTTVEKIFNEKASNGAFTLVGYNQYEDMKEFISGDYVITDGEVKNDFNGNFCVISEELASLNDLSVGDTITVQDAKNADNTYELEVTGIYKENTDSANNVNNMFSQSANKIITNVNFIKTILETNEDLEATIMPTYILSNASDAEKFANEVSEKGLSEYYEVTNNISEIKSATSSINNVKTFATTFLIITIIIGSIVLVVINMINIRERKYEIGVLRTIGMKKNKVSFQFILELLIVSMLSLSIGAALGALTSVPIANNLLASEINSSNSEYSNISKNFGIDDGNSEKSADKESKKMNREFNFGVTNINKIDSINAVVNFKVLSELLGIGLLLTLISSLASMIAISRFSPLTILKERS